MAVSEVEPRGALLVDQDHPFRVFVLTEQCLIAKMVKPTLNHGVYVTRDARDLDDAWALVATTVDRGAPVLASEGDAAASLGKPADVDLLM